MKRKQLWTGAAASIGMLILILDGQTALNGAKAGIELCLKAAIPSLFPFFLLSTILTKSFGRAAGVRIPLLCRLLGVPKGTEAIVLTGFLAGYPVGAKLTAQAWRTGTLNKPAAERMLGFCSNAGPAFLFGMAGSLFTHPGTAWVLWAVQLISALMVSAVLPREDTEVSKGMYCPAAASGSAIGTAIQAMGTVCGWIVIFRVIISFLQRWILWMFPVPAQVALIGLLELSNGCYALEAIPVESLRFLLCACMLSCGGICIAAQTATVTDGLSLKYYLTGKLLQTAFSFIISLAIIQGIFYAAGVIFLAFVFFLLKGQKRCSIRVPAGV